MVARELAGLAGDWEAIEKDIEYFRVVAILKPNVGLFAPLIVRSAASARSIAENCLERAGHEWPFSEQGSMNQSAAGTSRQRQLRNFHRSSTIAQWCQTGR
jgi:hypothetical protein